MFKVLVLYNHLFPCFISVFLKYIKVVTCIGPGFIRKLSKNLPEFWTQAWWITCWQIFDFMSMIDCKKQEVFFNEVWMDLRTNQITVTVFITPVSKNQKSSCKCRHKYSSEWLSVVYYCLFWLISWNVFTCDDKTVLHLVLLSGSQSNSFWLSPDWVDLKIFLLFACI